MKNVITYCRVATPENAEVKLNLQRKLLKAYCESKSLNIINEYSEICSGVNLNRESFSELLNYVRNNRKEVDAVLVTKWDRLSKNIEDFLQIIKELQSYNIDIISVEQPLDLNKPDNKAMLALYLVMPQIENNKLSIRTKEGIRMAKERKEKRKCLVRCCNEPREFEKFRKQKVKEEFEFIVLAEKVKSRGYQLWACENKNELIKLCLGLSDANTLRVAKSIQEGLFDKF